MKKSALILVMLGFLFLTDSLYAAGDLIVNGKLGLGVNVPQNSLDIVGSGVRIANPTYAGNGFLFSQDSSTGNLNINYMVGGSLYSLPMTIGYTGNVGLATPSPAAPFHVNKEDVAGVQIGTAASVGTMWFGAYSTGGNSGVGFASIQSGWGPLALNRNGNGVAIGATNSGLYTVYVSGDIYTTYGSWHGSDIKLKKNLLPISDSLSAVIKLNGVSFEWKDDYYKMQESPDGPEVLKNRSPQGRHYGVIAQEIEKVLPELVKENSDGIKAVNYTELIPVLIEAIKEQQKQIGKLQQEKTAIETYLCSKDPEAIFCK